MAVDIGEMLLQPRAATSGLGFALVRKKIRIIDIERSLPVRLNKS